MTAPARRRHRPPEAAAFALLVALTALLWATPIRAEALPPWETILERARGQTVYWNAWGGSEAVNGYIAWVGDEVERQYGIELVQVKLGDTGEAVARVLAEKIAGQTQDGSVDLIWINGENFAAMKAQGLLFGPWAEQIPNFRFVDVAGKPTVRSDFGTPTDGYESPWGMAQLVYYYDSADLPAPPPNLAAIADWAAAHPGRFAYPSPPDFLGSTFLKQALYELGVDRDALLVPPSDAAFAAASSKLWDFLDRLHPHLWRGGAIFPKDGPALRQLLDDDEIDLAFTFNPSEASAMIGQGRLPASVRGFVPEGGSIGNTHFVAIPFNANAKEAAMVVADFLLSPIAQMRKADETIWGDPTVIDVTRLDPESAAAFENLARGPATPSASELRLTLPEPHPDWMVRLEAAWKERYGG